MLGGALWLQHGGSALGGAGRVALLEAIRDTGSMTHAAKAVGISYKTAWDHVQDMNNIAALPLVQRQAGGAGGGGTVLTEHALELIRAFRQVEHEHAGVLRRLASKLADPQQVLRDLSRLSLRTSARNQLVGQVVAVQRGAVNATVELALPGADDRIHVSLTMASLQRLGIAPGVQAVALIKAPSVFIAAPEGDAQWSVQNRLPARVSAVQRGAVNAEVQLRLAGGQTMVAMLSLDSQRRLKLKAGLPVLAMFQESSVMLGVV
jgi:molybdate transport system regulatory protein